MESYLMITQINDFIFCPRSIFFHNLYRSSFDSSLYKESPQLIGAEAHSAIDGKRYSSKKNIFQGIAVYSDKYRLMGRIDIFDADSGCLTERKYSITAIYDGFRYQLYAQFFALTEMGFLVRSLNLYSSRDHKTYPVPLPTPSDISRFENILKQINEFSLDSPNPPNPEKCKHCNYRELCDISRADEDSL